MISKKKATKKILKVGKSEVVVTITTGDAKDTLFPEKVAKAKETLSKTNFNGYL